MQNNNAKMSMGQMAQQQNDFASMFGSSSQQPTQSTSQNNADDLFGSSSNNVSSTGGDLLSGFGGMSMNANTTQNLAPNNRNSNNNKHSKYCSNKRVSQLKRRQMHGRWH